MHHRVQRLPRDIRNMVTPTKLAAFFRGRGGDELTALQLGCR